MGRARWCSGVLSRRPALSSRPVSWWEPPACPSTLVSLKLRPRKKVGGHGVSRGQRPVSPDFLCAGVGVSPRVLVCAARCPGPSRLAPSPPTVPPGLLPPAGTQLSLLFPRSFLLPSPTLTPLPRSVRGCVCCSLDWASVHPRLEPAALGTGPVYRGAHPGPPGPSVPGHLQGAQHHPRHHWLCGPGPFVCVPTLPPLAPATARSWRPW